MSFATAIRTCFSKYVTFSGRASRPEYWYFFLFALIAGLFANIIDAMFFSTIHTVETETMTSTVAVSDAPVAGLVGLALFLPHLAAAWRRMHDTGRSGLYALFPMVMTAAAFGVLVFGLRLSDVFAPGGSLNILFTRATLLILLPTLAVMLISPLLVLLWLSRPSQPGANRFGPSPKEVA
jgi:uncharacterized membrane protein YhaH (DUF805 family)